MNERGEREIMDLREEEREQQAKRARERIVVHIGGQSSSLMHIPVVSEQ